MADDSLQEKTEQPTSKKLSKARDEGQVAKSSEVASVAVILIGVTTVYIFSEYIYVRITAIILNSMSFKEIPDFTNAYVLSMLKDLVARYISIVIPVMLAIFVTALSVNIMQVGFNVSLKAIEPKFSKFNVVKGLIGLVSQQKLVELIKSVLKLGIIGFVTYLVVKGKIETLNTLPDATPAFIMAYILKVIFQIMIYVILVMIVVAFIDLVYQKWKFNKDMMMTKEEVKEERKQAEGSPLVKSKIRSLQIQAARRRMMAEVPQADVVVTNPIHLAVAIQYDPISMGAPRVVAKGAEKVAERIKDIARENQIPIVENKELAQNLYKLLDIGDEIPNEYFKAVAEILAYVYRLKGKSL